MVTPDPAAGPVVALMNTDALGFRVILWIDTQVGVLFLSRLIMNFAVAVEEELVTVIPRTFAAPVVVLANVSVPIELGLVLMFHVPVPAVEASWPKVTDGAVKFPRMLPFTVRFSETCTLPTTDT